MRKIGRIVGIGGRYCAGKGLLCALFARRGYRVIDVDTIGHQILRQKSVEIGRHFGSAILDADGNIDRKRLGATVFGEPKELRWLEGILHPPMRRRVEELISELQPANIVIDAALLWYLRLDTRCDVAIWVRAPAITRLLRARKRDRLSWSAIAKLMRSQKKLKLKGNLADIQVVSNHTSPKRFIRACERRFAALWETP